MNELVEIAREAGRRIMQFYQQPHSVTYKSNDSPLTDADNAAHHYILEALNKLHPRDPVVSEESASQPGAEFSSWNRFWLVDPLDGTKEFIKGTGEFTVNIALIEKRRPLIGIVHAPALDLTYYADPENRAWRLRGTEKTVLQTSPINPAQFRVVASRDHAGPQVKLMLDRMPGAGLLSMGSSLKFCLVAAGEADLYLRDVPTMEWDTAAAHCIVQSAGGGIFTLDGTPLEYQKASLTNPALMTVGDLSWDWAKYLK
jgi:3'(2'), 5'-bisphosphate nucleotidase